MAEMNAKSETATGSMTERMVFTPQFLDDADAGKVAFCEIDRSDAHEPMKIVNSLVKIGFRDPDIGGTWRILGGDSVNGWTAERIEKP